MITFTDFEKGVIQRLTVPNGWDDADARPIKRRIKRYFRSQGIACCCYCGTGMNGWHNMTIDIEHVLPKSKNVPFTFEPRNLGLSCKRCNMTIKGNDESFYTGTPAEKPQFQSNHYSLIHPALDSYFDHLALQLVQLNNKFFVKYTVVGASAKGGYTKAYFRLEELETNTLDEMQGLKAVELSPEIPEAIRAQVHASIKQIEAS